jgi:lysozyme
MKLSAAGLELIKRSEGFREQVYRDVAGLPTIGYGHRVKPGESFVKGVNEAQAAAMLENDVIEAERTVERLVRVTLTQGQFDALVDFCFNLGAGRLKTSSLLRELNAGRYGIAGEQLLRWDFAGGVVNSGLRARRQAEFGLWSKGRAA